MVTAFYKDGKPVSDMIHWKETPGLTQDQLEKLYLTVVLGTCGEELEFVVGAREVWAVLLSLLPP